MSSGVRIFDMSQVTVFVPEQHSDIVSCCFWSITFEIIFCHMIKNTSCFLVGFLFCERNVENATLLFGRLIEEDY